ncbi:TauD/TfdA family dioxygenase [Streptomyces sp. NPDC059755]|uniref:TauD/TfdA family dioxygenase n=1 Tax=Streptomyces sp. NPDC059755 TaxID=3346934 RepID=UPI00365D918D
MSGLNVSTDAHSPVLVTAPPVHDLSGAFSWVQDNLSVMKDLVLEHGHLMIRGLPVTSESDFVAIRDEIIANPSDYKEQATPRTEFGQGVFSSTDFPAAQAIKLHNENSYTLSFPGTLLFCCLVAPDTGGATTIGDVRRMLKILPGDLVDKFRNAGWLLTRNYRSHVSLPWRTAFSTESRSDVEDYCTRNEIGHAWLGEEHLRTAQRRSAIVRHPVTTEPVWFNHVNFWSRWSLDVEVRETLIEVFGKEGLPFDTRFGNGEEIGEEVAKQLDNAYEEITLRESWQPGDLMIVDNILSAHGRESFTGSRKVLVAMGDPVDLADCHPTSSIGAVVPS